MLLMKKVSEASTYKILKLLFLVKNLIALKL